MKDNITFKNIISHYYVFVGIDLQSLPSHQEIRRCDYGSGSLAITI